MSRSLFVAALLSLVACHAPGTDAFSQEAQINGAGIQARVNHGSAGYHDPYFPRLGNGGYDVEHYKVVLTVDPVANTLRGSATIAALAEQPLARFNLDLFGLEVSSIKVNGENAKFVREDHELVITPLVPLQSGQQFEAQVFYAGTPVVVPLAGIPVDGIGWMHEGELVITMSEPTGAMNWYPCNNHQRDKATHEFDITVPEEFTVAANGILKSIQTGEGTRRFHFVASDPMATYLATVNVGRFDVEEQVGPNDMPLTYYFPPATKEEIRESFRRTPEMITTLENWFGSYPFESYGGVVAGAGPPAALETQTLPVYGGTDPGISVQIHELAHQWFGNSVSFDTWRDLWLAESFASYAEWLWSIEQGEEDSLDDRVRRYYGFLSGAEHELMGDPGKDHLFGLGVYVRGPVALHALRLKIGDEAFFTTLKTWTATFRGKTATAEDFIALVEERSGQDLASFFEAWLYETELPEIPELGLSPGADTGPVTTED